MINRVAHIFREKKSFLIMTHKDPDVDAIGSMLALSGALRNLDKEVVNLCERPLLPPLVYMSGSEKIVQQIDEGSYFDVSVILDSSSIGRLGNLKSYLKNGKFVINIDHHDTNSYFGDFNVVESDYSSTAELIHEIIKAAGIKIDYEIAENIFAAIQSDTGSFIYDSTTPEAFRIGAEMMEYGVKPWDVAGRMIMTYGKQRLKLMEAALKSVEFYHGGKVGVITLSSEMFKNTGAKLEESEGFGDLTRCVAGVEISVLIRQTGESDYKFSLRSNKYVNAARLASIYGGGGHMRAAGFESRGALELIKKDFLDKTQRFLNGEYN
ncbi:bifunctional oligoribonuclease/PAP phosphatase NrnA [Thermodesulfobacteriota bacterium]